MAWHPLGWTPIGFAEIEPFPAAVLAHHYPNVPNHGDMTTYEDWDIGTTRLDLLVGGTPCQAFSVAGLRKGLEDHRGNLTLTFIDLADHFDPEWIVWENVPGVLSSKDNAFGCFLAGLCGASEPFVPDGRWGKCGVVSGPKRTAAWRILDAQYTGVAQRRRRVFVVAVRGSRNWASAAALFPVGESVFWDSAPSRKTRQGITCSPEGIAGNVSSKWSKGTGGPAGDEHYNLITHALRGDGFDASEDATGRGTPLVPVPIVANNTGQGLLTEGDVAATVRAGNDKGGGGARESTVVAIQAGAVRENPDSGPDGVGVRTDNVAYTLEARAEVQAVAFTQNTRDKVRYINGDGQIVGALAAEPGMKQTNYVAHPITLAIRGRGDSHNLEYRQDGTANALLTPNGGRAGIGVGAIAVHGTQDPCVSDQAFALGRNSGQENAVMQTVVSALTSSGRGVSRVGESRCQDPVVASGMSVRRLLPEECEKLQGFQRGYTNIPWRGKPESPDGPRYKALGNSMAVPCMAWIGKRIAAVMAIEGAA